jgi:SOS-response transcriptional repressor LexA
MNQTPADRLKALRIKRGYATAKEAAEAFGWNEVTYRSHENSTRNIPLHAARKYAAAYGATVAHIVTSGNGNESPLVNHVVHVPVIARVSAGTFRYDEPIEYEGVLVPAVPRNDVAASQQYSVIIDGPSVNKRIADGAFAICVPFDSFPGGAQHGQLVHVVRERAGLYENTIKELRFTPKGLALMPASHDPRYQEEIQMGTGEDDDTTVTIRGVVIGAYTPI